MWCFGLPRIFYCTSLLLNFLNNCHLLSGKKSFTLQCKNKVTLSRSISGRYKDAFEGKLRRWNEDDRTVQFHVQRVRGKNTFVVKKYHLLHKFLLTFKTS